MWQTYITQWISSRSLFTMMARTRASPTSDLPKLLNPMTWRHYEAAERYDKFDIFRMMNGNNTVTRQFGALMERYDVLLTPTLAIRVPEANGPYSLLRDEPLDPWVNRLTDACRYTMPGNETGLPASTSRRDWTATACRSACSSTATSRARTCCCSSPRRSSAPGPEWFGAVPPVHVTKGD